MCLLPRYVRQHHPHLSVRMDDWDEPRTIVPPLGVYDVLLHAGLLYHLRDPAKALSGALPHARILLLESEVVDSNDPFLACAAPA